MKIAFVGTHGVGKTTLSYDLAARLKRLDYSLDVVKEVARDCPLPINRDTTYEAQAWILHTQIARELAAQTTHEIVVCDRSALDNYAYLVNRMGRREELEPMLLAWMKTYRLLIKVPIWQRPHEDGVRDTAESFQRGIDATIDELIAAFGVKAFALPSVDPEAWPEAVLAELNLPRRARQETLFPEAE